MSGVYGQRGKALCSRGLMRMRILRKIQGAAPGAKGPGKVDILGHLDQALHPGGIDPRKDGPDGKRLLVFDLSFLVHSIVGNICLVMGALQFVLGQRNRVAVFNKNKGRKPDCFFQCPLMGSTAEFNLHHCIVSMG